MKFYRDLYQNTDYLIRSVRTPFFRYPPNIQKEVVKKMIAPTLHILRNPKQFEKKKVDYTNLDIKEFVIRCVYIF